MFEANDTTYLLRQLGRNDVVLFLGAGFSRNALNQTGNSMPVGKDLAEHLWELLNYDQAYDDTNLSEVFEAVLRAGVAHADVQTLLCRDLLCKSFPEEYRSLARVYWYRIYTTNIDDLLEKIYTRPGIPKLDFISYPHGEPAERDPTLERIQAIYLNGRLPCRPTEVTFSMRQYARRAGTHDPLYDQFARDYAVKTTIFIGTELNEPLFWQYLEARQARQASTPSEFRPKSFLIAPTIPLPRRENLRSLNVIPVEGTAANFLSWLQNNAAGLPSREEVLMVRLPGLLEVLARAGDAGRTVKELREFSAYFHHIPADQPAPNKDRSLYLMGASPRWEDIQANRDAPRFITKDIGAKIDKYFAGERKLNVIAVLGSAGCGKSTILRRLGFDLQRAGRAVYLTNSEELPKVGVTARALATLKQRVVLLFDNAEAVLGLLPQLAHELSSLSEPPILVIASRTSDFDRRSEKFSRYVSVEEVHVPNLRRREIEDIIRVLEENRLLGKLNGMAPGARIAEFEKRANRQLLVAMREATSGRGFDEIIEDEFKSLVPDEAKILYLCVALATEAGYRLTKQEFVGCSSLGSAESLAILQRNLRDVVIPTGPADDLLLLRHRVIAEFVVTQNAPRPLLKEAYIRTLSVLASEIGGKAFRSRTFRFYRDMINHLTIFRRFENDVTQARSIYDSLASRFLKDAQFHLQYGSMELEVDNLEVAENYIDQADSLDPGNTYISNARGHLYLRKAVLAASKSEAIYFRDIGSELLMNVIEDTDADDPYCFHIYCLQRMLWLQKWIMDDVEKGKELEHLRIVVNCGFRLYSGDRKLVNLKEQIERAYLSLASH